MKFKSSLFLLVSIAIGFFLISVLSTSLLRADSEKAASYFDQGKNKYLSGDTQGAIEYLEKVIEIEPAHEQAKALLSVVMGETASSYFIQGDYVHAVPLLEKLIKIFPEDQNIKRMHDQAKKGLGTIQRSEVIKSLPSKEAKKQEKKTKQETTARSVPKKEIAAKPARAKETAAKIAASKESKQKSAKLASEKAPKTIPEVSPKETASSTSSLLAMQEQLRVLTLKSELDRKHKELLELSQAQQSEEKKQFIQKVAVTIALVLLILSGGIIVFLKRDVWFKARPAAKRLPDRPRAAPQVVKKPAQRQAEPEPEPEPVVEEALLYTRAQAKALEEAEQAEETEAEPQSLPEVQPEPVVTKSAPKPFSEPARQIRVEPQPEPVAEFAQESKIAEKPQAEKPAELPKPLETVENIYANLCKGIEQIFQMVQNWDLSYEKQANQVVEEMVSAIQKNGAALIQKALGPYPRQTDYIFTHSANVGLLSCYLKKDASPKLLKEICLASILHDLGVHEKLALLQEPRRLGEAELEIMRIYRKSGSWLLRNCEDDRGNKSIQFERVSKIVEAMHDTDPFFDSNPPEEHAPESDPTILEAALAISLVETFEALTHERPYRNAYTPEQAVTMIDERSRRNGELKSILTVFVQRLNLQESVFQTNVRA